jgi:hypothetical protein
MAMLKRNPCDKKACYGSGHTKKVFRYLFGMFFAVAGLFLFLSKDVKADTILEENFDSCTLGLLFDAGCGWGTMGYGFNSPEVVNFGFSQSMEMSAQEGALKSGTQTPIGSTTFDVYFASGGDIEQSIYSWFQILPAGTGVEIQFSGNCADGIEISRYGSGMYEKVSCFWWYTLEVEWNNNTALWKFRLKNVDWSENYSVYSGYFSVLQFWADSGNGLATIYIDNISAVSEAYQWPLPYFPETPPPPFATEDCSGYNLMERLICELKNFVAGIFIPDATSTAKLQQNLDLVKQRAPYNYISATKEFFISANASLTTSTPEISILGATGTLDFSLLNTTTTFAGTEQNISTILRGFFTFILILGFIFWAIGYLRKIFK